MKPSHDLSTLFKNARILVTGGTGSIGSEIVRQLLKFDPRQIRILSRDEFKQHRLAQELHHPPNVRFILGDVRDRDRVGKAMENIDIVFHAAALKHVPACEFNPFEAVKTNVQGTQNVIDKAIYAGASRIVAISTDKAAAPLSVMGATKLLAEKIVTNALYHQGGRATVSSVVRFGNVLASRGSVTDVFQNQIQSGNFVTVTDPQMTRFMMTVQDAVRLVFEAASVMQGSEVFVLKMPVFRLADLAKACVDVFAPKVGKNPKDISVEITGIRPGEKRDELLMTKEEARFALEKETMFILRPYLQFPDLAEIPEHRYGNTC